MKKQENMVNQPQEEKFMPEGYEEGVDIFAAIAAQRRKEQEMSGKNGAEAEKTQTIDAKKAGGELRRELAELLAEHPALREKLARGESLPREVIARCVAGHVPLRMAYAEYEARAAKSELEQLRREVEILRQNAAAAAKAPVRGTAGGADNRGSDPFIEGFLSVE